MSNRLKGKALPQVDPHRKPKKNRRMISKQGQKPNAPDEDSGDLFGSGIILACLVGLAFWFVAWLAFC